MFYMQDEIKNKEIIDEEFVATDSEGVELSSKDKIKDLRDKLKKCEIESKEYLNGWQRAKADLVNARKRDEEEKREMMKYMTAKFVEELIPVLSSISIATGNKESWEKVDKNWRMGVEYIFTQLLNILKENGVEEFGKEGDEFDTNSYEAVENVASIESKQDGKVASVVSKGYKINGKIIKAAQVKVFKI